MQSGHDKTSTGGGKGDGLNEDPLYAYIEYTVTLAGREMVERREGYVYQLTTPIKVLAKISRCIDEDEVVFLVEAEGERVTSVRVKPRHLPKSASVDQFNREWTTFWRTSMLKKKGLSDVMLALAAVEPLPVNAYPTRSGRRKEEERNQQAFEREVRRSWEEADQTVKGRGPAKHTLTTGGTARKTHGKTLTRPTEKRVTRTTTKSARNKTTAKPSADPDVDDGDQTLNRKRLGRTTTTSESDRKTDGRPLQLTSKTAGKATTKASLTKRPQPQRDPTNATHGTRKLTRGSLRTSPAKTRARSLSWTHGAKPRILGNSSRSKSLSNEDVSTSGPSFDRFSDFEKSSEESKGKAATTNNKTLKTPPNSKGPADAPATLRVSHPKDARKLSKRSTTAKTSTRFTRKNDQTREESRNQSNSSESSLDGSSSDSENIRSKTTIQRGRSETDQVLPQGQVFLLVRVRTVLGASSSKRARGCCGCGRKKKPKKGKEFIYEIRKNRSVRELNIAPERVSSVSKSSDVESEAIPEPSEESEKESERKSERISISSGVEELHIDHGHILPSSDEQSERSDQSYAESEKPSEASSQRYSILIRTHDHETPPPPPPPPPPREKRTRFKLPPIRGPVTPEDFFLYPQSEERYKERVFWSSPPPSPPRKASPPPPPPPPSEPSIHTAERSVQVAITPSESSSESSEQEVLRDLPPPPVPGPMRWPWDTSTERMLEEYALKGRHGRPKRRPSAYVHYSHQSHRRPVMKEQGIETDQDVKQTKQTQEPSQREEEMRPPLLDGDEDLQWEKLVPHPAFSDSELSYDSHQEMPIKKQSQETLGLDRERGIFGSRLSPNMSPFNPSGRGGRPHVYHHKPFLTPNPNAFLRRPFYVGPFNDLISMRYRGIYESLDRMWRPNIFSHKRINLM
jgi:hypothetical protein